MNANNPFSQYPYHTPHNTIPFDHIRTEDFEPAILKGIQQEEEAINQIIHNTEPPTFENVIAPQTDYLLDHVTTVLYNLTSAHTSDKLDAVAEKMTPIITEHHNRISLNSALFNKVKHVYDNRNSLEADQKRLTEKVYQGFVRNGANLTPEEKEKFANLETELASVTLNFGQRLLKELNAYKLHITDEKELSGLPERNVMAAAEAARNEGMEGWIFTLHAPSFRPFMTYADNRKLRERMYMARQTLCHHGNEFDNTLNVERIVELRRQKALLLGYNTYADYILTHRMAGDTTHVYDFLNTLLDACMPVARCQVQDVEDLARTKEGPDFKLQPWDFAYYSHKLKMRLFDVDEEMLRPYFSLDKVQEGIFGLAHTLYGITFHNNPDIPVFHPDVKAYEVNDTDGRFLAVLYTDFFPRASKQSGAWMTSYQEQYTNAQGQDVRPHVSLTANFTPPSCGKPSLLSLEEVETFLHEFGHCLHGIFSQVRYQGLSGTNVWWDFVELPSQIMENYATEPCFLHTFARHFETNEPIPNELMQSIVEARKFQAAYDCIRQVNFGLLDMALYTQKKHIAPPLETFEQEATHHSMLLPHVPGCCMTVQFSHIMNGGYAAGYYSYKWAEVLDADAFSVFLKEGIFNKNTAQRFRECILSKGDTEPPMNLYRNFRGQAPTLDALLQRTGVTPKLKVAK